MNTNNLPGFTAESAVYKSPGHYLAASAGTGPTGGTAVVPQLPLGLSPDQLYWCRLACLYCRYTGYFCWPCFICAIIISQGGIATTPDYA